MTNRSIAIARQSLNVTRRRFDAGVAVVLTALRETETSLTTLARQLDTERALALARDDAATADPNVETLYRGGVGDFLDMLDAERTLIEAEVTSRRQPRRCRRIRSNCSWRWAAAGRTPRRWPTRHSTASRSGRIGAGKVAKVLAILICGAGSDRSSPCPLPRGHADWLCPSRTHCKAT